VKRTQDVQGKPVQGKPVQGLYRYRAWTGHSRSPTLVVPKSVTLNGTNRKPICDFLSVINSKLPPILHRFQVMADYWWN